MQTRYVLFAIALVFVFGLMAWLRLRNASLSVPAPARQQISEADLSSGERHIYDLLREVQGHAILNATFAREAGDATVSLVLDTNTTTLSSLSVNLSSLARKQKNDGLSDGAVKRAFVF